VQEIEYIAKNRALEDIRMAEEVRVDVRRIDEISAWDRCGSRAYPLPFLHKARTAQGRIGAGIVDGKSSGGTEDSACLLIEQFRIEVEGGKYHVVKRLWTPTEFIAGLINSVGGKSRSDTVSDNMKLIGV
jgi:hypothetical protein